MNKQLVKSVGALLAGFFFVVMLSIATDILLTQTQIMLLPLNRNTTILIWLVILYRTIYSIAGSYITASLAPAQPMRHAMIGGFIGLALSIIGAVVMREEGPMYYAISLIVLALPSAWLGGKLRLRSSAKRREG